MLDSPEGARFLRGEVIDTPEGPRLLPPNLKVGIPFDLQEIDKIKRCFNRVMVPTTTLSS